MTRLEESTGADRTARKSEPQLSADQAIALFHERLKERGLKSTAQRDDIARVFFQLGGHITAEELYAEVKKVSSHVGYATIYRTLKLLKECDLVYERHFDDAQARYETVSKGHHDHFICENCGKIIEFENETIERLQEIVARELGASLTRHRMELYGRCADCRSRSDS